MGWNLKLIFFVILYASVTFAPAKADCPEHSFPFYDDHIVLPAAPNSELWIPSGCLDNTSRLIFRQCRDDEWIPSNSEMEILCHYQNRELPSKDCPAFSTPIQTQGPVSKTICVRGAYNYYFPSTTRCMQGSLLPMELNIETEPEFIEYVTSLEPSPYGVYTLAARNMWPNKIISKNVNYENETAELQDTRCGRFGLPLKIENILPVSCREDECENMCLSLTTTETPTLTIDSCTDYVLSFTTNTFMRRFGCPSGYYRIHFVSVLVTYINACFAIQMLPRKIPVKDVKSSNIVQSSCNGTLMSFSQSDDVFVFRQLSEELGLTDEDHCLFALTTNEIIEYSDWDSIDFSQLHIGISWDNTMNYSRISNKDEVSYLAMKANGVWTWAVDTVSCVVCMHNIPIPDAEFLLNYNISERKLELEVTHQDFLYREKDSDPGFICFALIGEIYKANLTIFPLATSIGKYLIENVGGGQYWCSGHIIKSGHPLLQQSDLIYAYGTGFAFEVVRKCLMDCSFNIEDLYRFIEIFKANYELFRVIDSALAENKTTEIDGEFSFTIHLRLTLQDYVDINVDTNLVNLIDYQIETVFIYEQLKSVPLNDDSGGFHIRSFRSTEYCLYESTLSMNAITWRIVKLGETISTSSLCPHTQNNANLTQTCSGDSIHGAFWEELVDVPDCYTLVSESLLELYVNISNSNQTTQILQNLTHTLQENVPILLPMDVFLTSRILEKVKNVTFDDLKNVLSIYNSLMLIDDNFLKISAFYNSTNILLTSLDNILLGHTESCIVESSKYENITIHSPLIKTFILDSKVGNVSGIALYRPRYFDATDDNFETYSVRYIYSNETIVDLLNQVTDKDLVIGSYIPSEMLNILKNISIVLTVFFNDKLFKSTEAMPDTPDKQYFETNGKIISISIVGCNDNFNLPGKIPIFFKSSQAKVSKCEHSSLTTIENWSANECNFAEDSKCGHWKFNPIEGWSSKGCSLREMFSNKFQWLAVCECSHLTHFGYLINSNIEKVTKHEHKLTMITIIGSSFSLFGSLGIFITAVIFQNWRRKLSSKILIYFAAAVALGMFLMILINVNDQLNFFIANNTVACVAIGSILHYSVLVMFFWMLIIAYFQFKRYVVVFNLSMTHVLLKSTIIGWGFPLLPVATVIIVDHSLYSPENRNETQFCYPNGWALYLGVVSPIVLILVINSIVFLTVIVSLKNGLSNSICIAEATRFRMKLSQIRLSAFLFFTLGLTWIFGFMSKTHSSCYLVFSYLFSVTASVQGLILFLYFIVFDPNVRNLWLKYIIKIISRE